jgi:hypothetical protein
MLSIVIRQQTMFQVSLGLGAQLLIQHAPLSFPIAALFGAIIALWLDLPWRRRAVVAAPASATRSINLSAPQAGLITRIVTTVVMTWGVAVGGMEVVPAWVAPFLSGAATRMQITTASLALPFAATWWFVSFRHGRYDFTNVLLGSALLGMISIVPPALALVAAPFVQGPSIRDYSTEHASWLVFHFANRVPVYLLASLVLIGITLVLSRATEMVLMRVPIFRRRAASRTASAPSLPAPEAGMAGRLVTAAVMTIVVTNDLNAGISGTTAIVALLVARTWWFVSFRDGRLGFSNILAGSALQALIVTIALLPLPAILPSSLNRLAELGWRTLLFGLPNLPVALALRTGAYLLVTFVMIRITLALPRAVARIQRRLAPARASAPRHS